MSVPILNTRINDVAQAVSQAVVSGGRGESLHQLNGVWSRFYKSLLTQSIQAWPHVLTGVFILIVFWVGAHIVKFSIYHMARHAKRRQLAYKLLGKTAKIAIIIVGIVTALGTMGINITALVTSLGLTGFAIGLALKDPISNAIAGFMILFYEPFRIGDMVACSGAEGEVKTIQLRYTIVQGGNKRFMVPNSTLLGNVITVDDAAPVLEASSKAKPKKKSRSRKSS